MNLTPQMRDLARAVNNLGPDQKRIARRNARRRVLGAMKALRNALDEQFPPINHLKPPPKEKPPPAAKPGKLKLGKGGPWTPVSWRLFNRVVAATYGFEPTEYDFSHCYKWTDANKWLWLIDTLAQKVMVARPNPCDMRTQQEDIVDLWRRFWTEPVPLDDLILAAGHQVFLEQQRRKK